MIGFHNRTVLSPLPLASMVPSGEKQTLVTESVCPMRVFKCCPVAGFHNRSVLSPLPLASMVPSGEKQTLVTDSVCPMRVFRCCPVAAFHKRTVVCSLKKPPLPLVPCQLYIDSEF